MTAWCLARKALLAFCLWYICLFCVDGAIKVTKIDNYAVVIDAGSTGSRCFVFRVVVDEDDQRMVSSYSCGKVVPGLSSFKAYPGEASAYIAPLLLNAANIIPVHKQPTTIVHIKATAGMRLISEELQKRIWKSLVYGLNYRIDVPFLISEFNVGTIDGHEEAFFAVLASNYIAGSIDGNLHPVDGMPMLGALDMGGSSTQLIFYNGTYDLKKVNADDFWSHSWLNYGAGRIQERVLDYIFTMYMAEKGSDAAAAAGFLPDDLTNATRQCPGPLRVPNPCGFKDHRLPYLARVLFIGTGEGEKCMEIIERVIWPTLAEEDLKAACTRGRPCPIESIEHPSVRGHHFYAMSVYYYALDCMRQMGPDPLLSWPKPTLAEVEEAATKFCSLQWDQLHHQFVHVNPHAYTRESQLHDRCFESLYIITLLEKGFSFDRHERSITYALEVEGSEVEWTLGFALAEIDFRPHRDKIVFVDSQTWKYFAASTLREMFAPIKLLMALMHSSARLVQHLANSLWNGDMELPSFSFWK